MTGVQNGINHGVGIFFAEGLDTYFDGDVDVITFRFENILRLVMMEIFKFL